MTIVSAVTGFSNTIVLYQEILKPLIFLKIISFSDFVKLPGLINCTTYVRCLISKRTYLGLLYCRIDQGWSSHKKGAEGNATSVISP